MTDRLSRTRPSPRRSLVLLTVTAVVSTLLSVVLPPVTASAAGTVLFNNAFNNNAVDGTGTVTKPTPTSGSNAACLSASGNTSAGPLLSCPSSTDSQGSGKLRFTAAATNQVGGVYGSASFPTSNGLDVTFNTYQYGSTSGADGLGFTLAAIDPANPTPPTGMGPSGGSLGYSPAGSVRGLPNGYLGVGLDVFGNFSNTFYQGSGCTNAANITTRVQGAMVVRGPGNGLVGYCGLTTTYDGTSGSLVTLRASTRAASVVPVQVLINPTGSSFTSTSGVVVAAGAYKVVAKPVGQSIKTLTGALPAAPANLYPAASWVNTNGVPKQLAFGFVGSTGSVFDTHETSDVKVLTFNQVPQLSVSTTSYAVTAPAQGDPVSYVLNPSVQSGAAVSKPVSVTQTTPAGVKPLAAYGSGWVCADPVGQTVTCTTSASSFAAGASLPPVNVVAIVTATGVTSTTVQNGSSTTVSSADSNPGADSVTTAGTPPSPPSGVALSPTSGSVAGGTTVTMTGSSTVAPTAIEIGTAAELQAGTVVTLLPCASGDTTSCFAISGTSVLVYSPARASPATVQITSVTLGVAGSATYVYADRPAAPAAPTVTAGLGSATLTWVAPSDNSQPITGYVVTPYLSGVAQTSLNFDPATLTRTVYGLTAGGSYTFRIAAVNALGTSAASSASAAVVPYAVLNAPTIGTPSAGSSAVTVRWTAPTSTGGSPITGYVVTPYIGSVAQTPRTFSGTATTQVVTGLTPGTAYTFRVAAQNASGTTSLYRINAGGPAVTATDGGPDWAADNTSTSPYYGSGTNTTSGSPSVTLDPSIPAGTPLALFDTQRYDLTGGANMVWQLPVTAGATVKVRLYFANRYSGTSEVGDRVFDVSLDGTTVLNSFDVVAGAGGDQRATMREFSLTSDGTVTIGFTPEVENPLISAIEIIQTGVSTTGPFSAASTSATPNTMPALSFAAPPGGNVNLAYSNQLVVTGGTSPYTWSVSSGALPAGLTLNASTGLLSGTPTASGTFNLTVQVVDASGVSATKAVTLVIGPALVLTFAPGAGEVSVAYSYQSVRTGGTSPYAWAVTAGSLPTGVSLSTSTGLVSGTPTVAGSYSVTIAVTDAFQTVSRTATIVIAALPTITSAAPAAGQVGVVYSSTFVVSGGTTPYAWSVPVGSLPPGLTLDGSTGVLSGTPTTVGSSSFTVLLTDTYGRTATKAVTLVVGVGPLVITKTANASSVVPGGSVTYTVTIANTGTSAFAGLALSDPLTGVLDDATYNADAVATTGTLTYSSSTLGWNGTVPASGSVTITYSVTATSSGSGNEVLTNTVSSATLGTNCAPSSVDARCTATVTLSGLTIVHTAGVASTTPGSTVSFSIVATNTGQTSYAGAALTENLSAILDDATYNGNAGATSGSVAFSSPTLSWTGNLAVGASVTITYSVTVISSDQGNRSLTGTVVSPTPGSTCPSNGSAVSCTATVAVLVPALSITSTAGASTTTPGATVAYTVVIANTGQTAYTGASVTVALAAALDDATYGSTSATTGAVVYAAALGTVVWTGNLAVGASATVVVSVRVRDPDPADRVLTAVASSTAAGSSCPVGSVNPACTATVQVRVPQLTLTTTSSVTTTTPGSVVAYTVLLTNSGQTAYTGATFSDDLTGVLDDATYDSNVAATAGAVSFSSPSVAWTGNLAIGASATITFSVTVRSPDPADKTMTSRVVSTTPGATCPSGSSDTRCASTVTVLVPGLSIRNSADVATTTPGSVVNLTTSVTNTGQTTYTGAQIISNADGALDDATANGDQTVSTGSLALGPGANDITWTLTLAPGQSAVGTGSLTVSSPPTGNRALTLVSRSDAPGSTCPTGTTDPLCSATVQVLVPGLTITKTASAATVLPGGTVSYTIVVANTGQSSYAAASLTDPVSGVLDDATYNGGATTTVGTVSYAASTLSWSGALAPGATATITYTVTVRDPDPGDKRMASTVVSTSAGSNCASTSSDTRCTAAVDVLVPGLTIAKTANVATTVPGGTVGVSVTVTNSGATAQSGATFTDSLAGVLDDATYDANATATVGTVSYTPPSLTWTGTLAVGASATITYSATVQAAATGDNQLSSTAVSTTRGSNCTAGSTDPRCSVSVPVARLVIAQSYAETLLTPGQVLHASVTFTNTGQVPYTGIGVSLSRLDIADDAIPAGNQQASSGTLVVNGTDVSWTGSIAVGAVVTLTSSFTVRDPDPGNKVITGRWVSAAPGNNCPSASTDVRCTTVANVVVPRLTITKAASATAVEPGAPIGYTLTIANTGQTAYTGAAVSDSLVGVLDDATYSGGATATTGSVAYDVSTLTWTGNLAVGASAVVSYAVTTSSPGTGDKNAWNAVSSNAAGSTCPPGNNNPSCTTVTTVLTPALTITKSASTASTTLGASVVFTVVVANTGQTGYPAASFSDPLAGVLDDAAYLPAQTSASRGTVTYGAGVLGWSGALTPGQSATISYAVSVASPSTGNRTLTNTVTSTSTGSNCAAGAGDVRCAVQVDVINSVALSIVKTADVASTVPGAVVVFTVRLTNPTGSTISGASFTDALGGVLDDASYTSATASGGTVAFTSPNLTWTGDVAAQRTVTVTYTVTVGTSGAGDELLRTTTVSTSPPSSNSCLAGSTDPRCTVVVPVASLVLERLPRPPATTTPGSLLNLSARYTNAGQVPYTGISVDIPRAGVNDDAYPTVPDVASSGTLVRTETTVRWTGDIPVGGFVDLTLFRTVLDPDPGDKVLTATLQSDAPGSNCPTEGATDPRCTFTTTVLVPALTITTTASTASVVPGDQVGYTLTVKNTGQTPYTGVSVTDSLAGLLDDATYDADASATTGSVSYVGPTLTWTGNLAVGATATITFSVTAHQPPDGDKTMLNRVTSTTQGSTCPPNSTAGGCTVVTSVLTPALTITKTASVTSATLGATVTYTLVVANTGQTSYAAATVSDPLANVLDDATYNPGSTTGGPAYSAGTLSWTGPLAPGDTHTITYTVTVHDPDTGNLVLANTVTSTSAGNNCVAGQQDTRCSATVTVVDSVALTLTKTSDVLSTVDGAKVAFTVTATNATSLPILAADFSDPLGVGVLDDAVYDSDAVASSGTVTYAGSTVTWTGDVPAGGTVTVTYHVTVGSPATGNLLLSSTISSTSPGESNSCLGGSVDVRCSVVVGVARLVLERRPVPPATTTPGSVVDFSVRYTNAGKVPYVGIEVDIPRVDAVDDLYATGPDVASSGTLVRTNEVNRWTGDIPVGGRVDIAILRTINDPDNGDRVIRAPLQSDAPGSNCPSVGATDPRCTFVTRVLLPGLTVTKTASVASVEPGGAIGYTVLIRNSGETPYVGAVVSDSLAGVLDDATYAGGAVASSGGVVFGASTLTWTGDLAVGASATVTYSVTAKSAGGGDKTVRNAVSSGAVGSTCPPSSTNASCTTSTGVLTPELTFTASADTASATLGSTVVFTVVVANTGQTSYSAAAFSDALGGVLDDAVLVAGSASASSGTVGFGGGVLSWSGALAAGGSATVTFAVVVNSPSSGDRVLASAVTSASAGSSCAVGGADARCATQVSVLNSAALSIVTTANVASTVPGAVVVFTVRLTNPTGTAITGAAFTDALGGVLDDATYASATADVGVVQLSGADLTWTGDVAARHTVTVTYTVTVGTSGAGDELLRTTTVSTSPASSNSCLPGSTDPGCTVVVPVAMLLLTRINPPATATPGSVIDISARYTNVGQVPYTGITVDIPRADSSDDAFPTSPDLSTSGMLVRTPTAVRWTGDIPVGGSVDITLIRTVSDPDLGDKRITATFESDAPGSNCPTEGATDPRCTFVTVVLVPALTLTTTADATFVVPNGVVGYTTTIRNTGETPYVGASVSDSLVGVLDDATYDGDAAATAGSVAFVSPNLTWTGDLAVGQQAVITFTVTAHRPADGDKTMLTRVSSTSAGSTCLPDSADPACFTAVAVRTPSLTTVATADHATAVPGDLITYTVTATNDGQTSYTTATFDAPLAGLLDDAVYTGTASASSGTVVRSGDTLVWTGPLVQGASATITYAVTVQNPVPDTGRPGNHRLEQTLASVGDGSNCLTGSTDPRCSTSVPIASLHIVRLADVTTAKPTDVVHYTGTFTNTGQVPYVNITIVVDVLGAADDSTYNGDATATSGVVTIVPGRPEVSWTGDLAVGASAAFTSSATVRNPDPGDKIMRTFARTDAPGSNCPTGSSDPACSNVVTVLTPGLTITKAASTSSTTPGGTVGYTVTATNNGQTPYTAARVQDDLASVLSEATYAGDATATVGSVSLAGQVLTWTGDLGVAQSVTITYSVRVNSPDLGDRLLINRITSDELGSTCPSGGSGSACTSFVLVLVPALNITIAADATTTTPGATVGYTIMVTNAGQTPYTGATVTADLDGVLDDATYDRNGVSTAPGGLVFGESALTWTGNLAVGAATTITFTVTVDREADLGDRSLRTSVTSPDAGSTCATGSDCVSTVRVLLPRLAVSTIADVATATPGDPVRFSVTVHNSGETPYAGSVTTDLADVVDDATFDGTITASVGQAGYAGSVLTWSGSLATGDTATITYTVVVRAAPVPGNKLMKNSVVADAAGSTCATGSSEPSCTVSVTVLVPALSISKSASDPTTTPGGTIGYTILITNTGQTGYTGATVVDSLRDVLTDADYNNDVAVTGGGTADHAGSTLTWTGDLPVATTATIVYSVTVKNPDPGDKLLHNAVTSTAPGSSCPADGDAPACSTDVRVLVPALTITKTADRSEVTAGSPVAYTITVHNTGETPYEPATVSDDLVGVVDDATYAGGASATTGTVGYAGGTLSWTGALGLDETATITYSVTARYPATGDKVLRNAASSGSAGASCAPGGTDPQCSSTVAVVVPQLSITKTADTSRIVAGGTVRYTIEATNTGQADYAGATLSDSLTGLLDDAAYANDATASTGSVSYANDTVSWTGALGRGDTVVISYSVHVHESLSEDGEMSNAVVSSSVGSTCPPGNTVPACATTTAVEAGVLTLTDLTSSFTLTGPPGSTVSLDDAVSMTVTTNNYGGYAVTVQPGDTVLRSMTSPDSIPIALLEVRETGTTLYHPLTTTSAVTVHRQDGPSAPHGDAVTNDFQMTIPDVVSDAYSTELEYIATAQ